MIQKICFRTKTALYFVTTALNKKGELILRKKFKIILGAVCGIAFSAIGAIGLQNSKTVQAAEVAIDATNFPYEKFRTYIENNIDTDKNGMLSDEEINVIEKISISFRPLDTTSSLDGICYFRSLKHLSCDCNLKELDLSNNTKLEYLNCTNNRLTELDLSNNIALKELYCYNNNISKLNISNNTALTDLNCYHNQLTELDLSNNIALKYLDCGSNKLTKIDISKNINLGNFRCPNNQITDIDASNNAKLFSFGFAINNLKTIKLNAKLSDRTGFLDKENLHGMDTILSNLVNIKEETKGKLKILDITKPAKYHYSNNKCNGNITITYVQDDSPINPMPVPSGNFTAPSCTRLFNDYNYISPVSGSPVIIYGNGGTFKTGTVKTTNKQFTAYTDILASYKYTLNSKGIVKPAAGKVIVGITKSNTKPVVTKNKIVDADAAKIARAKIKNGQITVTAAGKGKGLVYLWIIDTGDKGASECCPVNVLLAPRKLEVQDTSGSKLNNPKIENGKTLDVCVTGFVSSTKTDDCTYTATVAPNSQGYISIVPNGNSGNKFTITATGLKNNKNTKATVIFQCNENGKKVKFSLTVLK